MFVINGSRFAIHAVYGASDSIERERVLVLVYADFRSAKLFLIWKTCGGKLLRCRPVNIYKGKERECVCVSMFVREKNVWKFSSDRKMRFTYIGKM